MIADQSNINDQLDIIDEIFVQLGDMDSSSERVLILLTDAISNLNDAYEILEEVFDELGTY